MLTDLPDRPLPGEDPRVQELQRYVKVILNTDEYTNQRLKAIAALRKFFHAPENEAAVRSNYEKLQSTLKPLLSDRIGAIRSHAALLIGDLGASPCLQQDANKFISWVFQHLHHTGTEKKLYFAILKQVRLADWLVMAVVILTNPLFSSSSKLATPNR